MEFKRIFLNLRGISSPQTVKTFTAKNLDVKTPWGYSKQIEQLEEKIEELEEELEACEQEKEGFRERFEAEKERRSKLSTEKQEAEKQLKKFKQRLENRPETQEKQAEKKENTEIDIRFKNVFEGLKKVSSIESEEKDLLTVYSGEGDFPDLKALKNSVSQEVFQELERAENFVAFTDEKFLRWKLETRPFMESDWSLEKSFRPEKILGFIKKEKYWILAGMGDTKIFREASGSFEEVERVKSRVNRKQKKGGFSQGRFERKRDEQIEGHVKKINEALEEIDGEVFVLGDRRLCEDIDGEYLGGFDSSKPVSADVFYNFQFTRF